MTPEQNKRAVVDAWKAFASRDPQRVRAAFTDDAEWLAPKDNATGVALGFTDHMIGPDTIVRFLVEEFPKLFVADVSVDFTHLLCDGDTVVLEMRLQATLPSGRAYDNDYCFILELREGRIARMREYMDAEGPPQRHQRPSRRSQSCRARACSSRLSSLPLAVVGMASITSMRAGRL